jgi:hypothetical protein
MVTGALLLASGPLAVVCQKIVRDAPSRTSDAARSWRMRGRRRCCKWGWFCTSKVVLVTRLAAYGYHEGSDELELESS